MNEIIQSRPHGLQPIRLSRPWDFPAKSTGVGCHCLLKAPEVVCAVSGEDHRLGILSSKEGFEADTSSFKPSSLKLPSVSSTNSIWQLAHRHLCKKLHEWKCVKGTMPCFTGSKTFSHVFFHLTLKITLWSKQDRYYYPQFSGKEIGILSQPRMQTSGFCSTLFKLRNIHSTETWITSAVAYREEILNRSQKQRL